MAWWFNAETVSFNFIYVTGVHTGELLLLCNKCFLLFFFTLVQNFVGNLKRGSGFTVYRAKESEREDIVIGPISRSLIYPEKMYRALQSTYYTRKKSKTNRK